MRLFLRNTLIGTACCNVIWLEYPAKSQDQMGPFISTDVMHKNTAYNVDLASRAYMYWRYFLLSATMIRFIGVIVFGIVAKST